MYKHILVITHYLSAITARNQQHIFSYYFSYSKSDFLLSFGGRFMAELHSEASLSTWVIQNRRQQSMRSDNILKCNQTFLITVINIHTKYIHSFTYCINAFHGFWWLTFSVTDFLPAWRYASAGNRHSNVSVCLSVCLSVTRRYCVKTRKLAAWFLHHLIAPRL